MSSTIFLPDPSDLIIGYSGPLFTKQRAWSILCWVKLKNYRPSACILGCDKKIPRQTFQLLIKYGRPTIQLGAEEFSHSGTIPLNQWTCLAFVVNGANNYAVQVSLFLNGIKDVANVTNAPAFGNHPIYLSRFEGGNGLDGNLTQVRICHRLLDDAEVNRLKDTRTGEFLLIEQPNGQWMDLSFKVHAQIKTKGVSILEELPGKQVPNVCNDVGIQPPLGSWMSATAYQSFPKTSGIVSPISAYPSNRVPFGRGDQYFTTRSFSFLCWIRIRSYQPDNAIIGADFLKNAPNHCLHLTIRNGKAYMGFFNNDLNGSQTIPLNTWVHLAFVYEIESRSQAIYVNGQQDAIAAARRDPYLGPEMVYLGQYNNGNPLNGSIAKIRLAQRALSIDEINRMMHVSGNHEFFAVERNMEWIDQTQELIENGCRLTVDRSVPGSEPIKYQPASPTATLNPGESLLAGQYLRSSNGLYYAVLLVDGSFGIFTSSDFRPENTIWSVNASEKYGYPEHRLLVDGAGHLHLLDRSSLIVWKSTNQPTPSGPFQLTMGNDRNLIVSDSVGNTVWSSNTAIELVTC